MMQIWLLMSARADFAAFNVIRNFSTKQAMRNVDIAMGTAAIYGKIPA